MQQRLGHQGRLQETGSAPAPQSSYTPIVQQLKDKSSNYAQSGATFNSTVLLRREAKLQGVNGPKFIWDCTLQCYDRQLLKQGGADVEGQYVSLLFLPFEEATRTRRSRTSSSTRARSRSTGFGIQAYASGLLVSQAIKKIVETAGVNGVTRKALFDQLNTIKCFNAGGMIGDDRHRGAQGLPVLRLDAGEERQVRPRDAVEEGDVQLQAAELS